MHQLMDVWIVWKSSAVDTYQFVKVKKGNLLFKNYRLKGIKKFCKIFYMKIFQIWLILSK